ncbi:MAG: ATP-binding protein [Candidatus Kapaibacterium sp.]
MTVVSVRFLNQLTHSSVISQANNPLRLPPVSIMSSSPSSEYQVLGRVAGGLAHDLNNHLSPILLGVQTLQRHDPDEKTMRILLMIEQAARKASDLLRHVLEYSRDARTSESKLSRNDVVALLMDQVNLHLGTSAGFTVKDGTGWSLAADADIIVLVISSLLRNALESGSPREHIHVELSFEPATTVAISSAWVSPRDRACIVVSDKGAGMSADVVATASHPFFTTRSAEGHPGLGLFLVHTLVKQLNGSLQIVSKEQEGTSVRAYLPVSGLRKE